MYKSIIIPAIAVSLTFFNCSDDKNEIMNTSDLLIQEENDLKFSREEEKLARDVYLFSYEKYGDMIFGNIAQSEQQHMDQVLVLLNYYKITDPASSQIGIFSDDELQRFYNELISKSSKSFIDALEVGALIEDLDINDLNLLALRTDKQDLQNLYAQLECGSRNHMRSYISMLDQNNIEYVPTYISQEEYYEIISQSNEQCGR